MKRFTYWLCSAIIVIFLVPLGLMAWASRFAARHECVMDAGQYNPCIVNGAEWGETLYFAFFAGWYFLPWVPVALVALVVLAVLALFDLSRHIRSRQKD